GNGYEFGNLGREGSQGTIGAEPDSNMYHPVTNISWRDAIVWLNAYSEMQGLDPVYCKDSGMTVPIKQSVAWSGDLFTEKGSQDNPYINLDSDGYRLPTEGEWQYAATDRGENGADFAAGNYQFWVRDLSASDYDYALFNYIETKKVGQLTSPNELEIFDMSGNVRELCVDYFEPYPFEAQDDYIGQGGIGMRVVRGGSWLDPDVQRYPIQSGFRQSFEQYLTEDTTGFRVARSMPR
ncbi:MAG: hypothetical protein D6B26_00110, partial [Spirochaetaceae bacterium]